MRCSECGESGGDHVKATTTLAQDGASSTTKTEVDAKCVTGGATASACGGSFDVVNSITSSTSNNSNSNRKATMRRRT